MGLQVEAGLEGKVRAGRWAPVRVTATNRGEPVSGWVELALPGARTAVPLELPPAAKKRVEVALFPQLPYATFGISPDQAAASLREGALHGSGGREIAGTQIPVKVLPDTSRLLVVCGEAAGGLRFLDGMSLGDTGWALPLGQQAQVPGGYGGPYPPSPGQPVQLPGATTVTAHLAPLDMPSEQAALEAADLLVIRDAAWRQLEPRQRRAVRQWTEMGGRLLLCGEDPGGFQDEEGRRLLPVAPIGPEPRPQLTALPLPGREPIRAGAGQVMPLRARPLPDAMVALREDTVPLVVTRPTGFGGVLWLGFDPFRVPPRTAPGRRALWQFLIAHATGMEVAQPGFPDLADVPAAYEPVKRLPHFPAPSRWTLAAFGLVYVLVFGPLNIWLLRRLRRTVRAWLLMPALSLLMTGGVLALGTAWGQAKVVFHAASLLETMAGSGTAREQCYAVLFSPTNRAFGLEIDDPAPDVRFLPGEEGTDQPASGGRPGAGPSRGPEPAMPDVRDGDLCRWDRIALTLWTIQPIAVDRAVDLGSGVRIDLDDHLTGRVVNGTPQPLRGAYLQFHGWRQALGELAPGAVLPVTPAGWQRHVRDASAGQYGETEGPAGFPRGTSGEAEGGATGDDLLGMAGSLLRTNGDRSAATPGAEVVLAARAPGVLPPVRVPGVARSPAEGLSEGALLLVRKLVSPAAGLPGGGAGHAAGVSAAGSYGAGGYGVPPAAGLPREGAGAGAGGAGR